MQNQKKPSCVQMRKTKATKSRKTRTIKVKKSQLYTKWEGFVELMKCDTNGDYEKSLEWARNSVAMDGFSGECDMVSKSLLAKAYCRTGDMENYKVLLKELLEKMKIDEHETCRQIAYIIIIHARSIETGNYRENFVKFYPRMLNNANNLRAGVLDDYYYVVTQYVVDVLDYALKIGDTVFALTMIEPLAKLPGILPCDYLISKSNMNIARTLCMVHSYQKAVAMCDNRLAVFPNYPPMIKLRQEAMECLAKDRPIDGDDRYRLCSYCEVVVDREPLVAKGTDVTVCGYCYKLAYCSEECYTADWAKHSLTCTGLHVNSKTE